MGAGGSSKICDGVNGKPNIVKVREKNGVNTCENNVHTSTTIKVKRKQQFLPMIVHNVKPGSQPPNSIGGVLVITCQSQNDLIENHANTPWLSTSPTFSASTANRMSNSNNTQYAWYVQDAHHIGAWQVYNAQSSARLQRAYLAGQPNCMVVYEGHTATVNFNTMQQTFGSNEVCGLFPTVQTYRQQQQQHKGRRAVKRCQVQTYVDEMTGTVAKREVQSAVTDPFDEQLVNHSSDNNESNNSCNNSNNLASSITNANHVNHSKNVKVIVSGDGKHIEITDMTHHVDTSSINNVYNVFADTNIEQFEVARGSSTVLSTTSSSKTGQQQTGINTSATVTSIPQTNASTTSTHFPLHHHKVQQPVYISATFDSAIQSDQPVTRESVPVLDKTIKVQNNAIYTMQLSTNFDFQRTCRNTDENLVLVAGRSNKLVQCNIRNGFVHRRYEYEGMNSVTCTLNARIAPSCSILAAASDDTCAYIIHRCKTKPTFQLRGHRHKVYDLYFSHDEQHVYTVSMDGTMRSWNLAHFKQCTSTIETKNDERSFQNVMSSEQTYQLSKSHIFSLALSPTNPNLMLAGGNSAVVMMIDLRQSNVVVQRFTGHKEAVWCCRFSRNTLRQSNLYKFHNDQKNSRDTYGIDASNIFTSCGLDGTVRLWDVRRTQKMVHEINPHTGHPVHHVQFTYDNKGLLSCAKDGTVALTDTISGKCVWRAKTSSASAFRVHAQLPCNNSFVVSSSDGLLNIWKWKAS